MMSCTSSWDLHTFSRPKCNISEIKKIQEKMLWNHWFSNIAFWIKYHLHGILRMWWVKMLPVLTVLNLVIDIWPTFWIQNEYLEIKFLELFYFKMFLIKFCGHEVQSKTLKTLWKYVFHREGELHCNATLITQFSCLGPPYVANQTFSLDLLCFIKCFAVFFDNYRKMQFDKTNEQAKNRYWEKEKFSLKKLDAGVIISNKNRKVLLGINHQQRQVTQNLLPFKHVIKQLIIKLLKKNEYRFFWISTLF